MFVAYVACGQNKGWLAKTLSLLYPLTNASVWSYIWLLEHKPYNFVVVTKLKYTHQHLNLSFRDMMLDDFAITICQTLSTHK